MTEPQLVLQVTSEYFAVYKVNKSIVHYNQLLPFLDALEKSGLIVVDRSNEYITVQWNYRWSPFASDEDLPETIIPSQVKEHVDNDRV